LQPLPQIGVIRQGNTAVFHYLVKDENNGDVTGSVTIAGSAVELDVASPQTVTLSPVLVVGTTDLFRIPFDSPNSGRWKIDVHTTVPVKTRTVGFLTVLA